MAKTDIISNKWTTKELKSFIRESTSSINYRLLDYYENTPPEKRNPIVEAERQRLIDISGVRGRGGFIGLGLEYKNKPALVQQARALQDFMDADVYTPGVVEKYNQKEEAAYNSFIQNHPQYSDMTQQEYHDFIEALGALGSHITDEFIDSENVLHLYDQASTKEKRTLATAMKEVVNQSKGQGYSQENMLVMLRNKLGIGE